MGVSVLASFPNLIEAEVACGALRASGFDAQVLDVHLGVLDSIGGFRLAVPDDQRFAASALLDELRGDAGEAR